MRGCRSESYRLRFGVSQTYQNYEISVIDADPFIRERQYNAWQELENVGFIPAYDQ